VGWRTMFSDLTALIDRLIKECDATGIICPRCNDEVISGGEDEVCDYCFADLASRGEHDRSWRKRE
jgi:hypothetical protein